MNYFIIYKFHLRLWNPKDLELMYIGKYFYMNEKLVKCCLNNFLPNIVDINVYKLINVLVKVIC